MTERRSLESERAELVFKTRPEGFLSPSSISHDSEHFDYIVELHDWLWRFVNAIEPGATGQLKDCVPSALRAAAVQGEPVAWCNWHELENILASHPVFISPIKSDWRKTPLYRSQTPVAGWDEKLLSVISALDRASGDTDPSNIESDEECRDQYPMIWAMQQLCGMRETLRRLDAQDQKPPPAAGWDEAIESASVTVGKLLLSWGSGVVLDSECRHDIVSAIEALRRNAPPDHLERTLLIAAKAGLNYITNTEAELGITLASGDLLRDAIGKIESYATLSETSEHLSDDGSSESISVAANASAEARLRENSMRGLTDLERTLLIASKAAQNYIANTESELGMALKSGELLRAAIAKAEACEISTHPHASDCDKQEEKQ